MRAIIGIAAIAMAVAGCTAVTRTALYEQHPLRDWVSPSSEVTYRIADNPNIKGVIISPSTEATALHGATLGLSTTPATQLRAAAEEYLKVTGRANCTIVKFEQLLSVASEATYTCA